jgi:deoxyribose-phosphate aldolase
MIIEYANFDIANNDTELKNDIAYACQFNVDTIAVLPNSVKTIRAMVPDNISIATPIDFPMGIADPKSRVSQIEFAAKNGVNKVDILIPTHSVCNRKYDKLREDIKTSTELCGKLNITVRYILEYRIFTYETLYKIAQILNSYGITEILPSSGHMLDNITDNILAGAMINKKVPNINIICNGNVWNNTQIDNIVKTNLYGLRIHSINGLKLVYQKIAK